MVDEVIRSFKRLSLTSLEKGRHTKEESFNILFRSLLLRAVSLRRTMSRKNAAVVLNAEGANIIAIDLNITDTGSGKTVLQKSLAREPEEEAMKALEKVRMMMAPPQPKLKGRAAKSSREEILKRCPEAEVLDENGAVLDTLQPNRTFWSCARVLKVGEYQARVLYNVPTVTGLTPPTVAVAGSPVVVSGIRVMFATEGQLEHEWYVLLPPTRERPVSTPRRVAKTKVLFPPENAIGAKLRYRCRVIADGSPWSEVDLPNAVIAPLSKRELPRWKYTKGQQLIEPNEFRVVSYNILHDAYATSKFAKTKLYPFATDEVLCLSRRSSRIATELMAYEGDIICLQECGKDIYEKYWRAVFDSLGFDSIYQRKCGNVNDGLCTAVRRTKLRQYKNEAVIQEQDGEKEDKADSLLGFYSVPLLMSTLAEIDPEISAEIRNNHEHLYEALNKVTSVGTVGVYSQVVASDEGSTVTEKTQEEEAKGSPPRYLLIGNTHLFYHADGCHIRALQVFMLRKKMIRIQEEILRREPSAGVSVILCGDFNFTRVTGGYALTTHGEIDEDNSCWAKGVKFWWGCDRQLGIGNEEAAAEEQEAKQENAQSQEAAVDILQSGGSTQRKTTEQNHAADKDSKENVEGQKVEMKSAPTHAYRPSLKLSSPLADSHIDDKTLIYSNYSLSFKAILDHIFYSKENVDLIRTIPSPTEEELSENVCIPSEMFPSDHVAIVADFRFKE